MFFLRPVHRSELHFFWSVSEGFPKAFHIPFQMTKQFLDMNPGLQSRFPNVVEFKDYDLEQLMQIANLDFSKNGYVLTDEATEKLSGILDEMRQDPKFGNGRYVRNIFERATTRQAMRISTLPELNQEILTTILPEDIEKI